MAGNENSGRRRLSIAEHLEARTYREDRHGPISDDADGVPVMPRGMDADARACWKAVVPDLVSRGLARAIDTHALRQMCELWSLYLAAIDAAKKDAIDRAARGAVRAYLDAFQAIAQQFGLTVGSRRRLKTPPRPAKAPGGVASRERT